MNNVAMPNLSEQFKPPCFAKMICEDDSYYMWHTGRLKEFNHGKTRYTTGKAGT